MKMKSSVHFLKKYKQEKDLNSTDGTTEKFDGHIWSLVTYWFYL